MTPGTSQWWVYIVRCADNSYYTGVTTCVSRRVRQHNGLRPGGAKYTRSRRPVVLVHCMKCSNRHYAMVREARIKKLSHERKARYDNDNYDRKQRYLGPPVQRQLA